jgi:hypothetical protein
MTINKLCNLLHTADEMNQGCTVEFIVTCQPSAPYEKTYGIVTYGRLPNQRIFHNEVELEEILTFITKK